MPASIHHQDLPDSPSPADHTLLHGGSSDELASSRLISPSYAERSQREGFDIALELGLEERFAAGFPARRTAAASRAFASRRRCEQQQRTSASSMVLRRRHTLANEVSHLHDMNCDSMFGEDRQDSETQRSAQSMPLPQTISLLASSMRALSAQSDNDGTADFAAGHCEYSIESHQNYQLHGDDDVAASHQNHRCVDDLHRNHEGDMNDHSSLSSHDSVQAEDVADPSEMNDIRRRLIQEQARESTAKLSQALTGLWSAINTSQREAGLSLQTANEKWREAERTLKKMAKKYKSLEKQNKKLSSKLERLQAENNHLVDVKSSSEAEFQEQMSNLVNMSLQTELDYQSMVAERDMRISQLKEESMRLSEALLEVEGRAEAEMRRRTWSEVSHSRDSPGGPSTSEREGALSHLEAPFANATQKEGAAEAVAESAATGAKISSANTDTLEVRMGIFRGRNINPKMTKKDYGLELESLGDSMQYLASPSACSTREDDRMTGEDEGLHFV